MYKIVVSNSLERNIEISTAIYLNLVIQEISFVKVNLTKAKITYNSLGSDFNKWVRNTLWLIFITTI